LKSNIQFFVKEGVTGVFEEGYHGLNGGEFHELRMWLLAKLLWNPNQDAQLLIRDFLNGYYGPAAPFLLGYLNTIQTAAEKEKPEMDCFANYNRFQFFSDATMTRAARYFDLAEQAVKNQPACLERVKIARQPVVYMQILLGVAAIEKAPADQKTKLRATILANLDQFEKGAALDNATQIGLWSYEGMPPCSVPEWVKFMRNKAQK